MEGEHLALSPPKVVALPPMVSHADAIKSRRIGGLRDLDQRRAKLVRPSRPSEIVHVQPQFHNEEYLLSVLSSLFPWVLPQKKSKNHSLSQSSSHFPMVSLLG